jgi:hypothetical protein
MRRIVLVMVLLGSLAVPVTGAWVRDDKKAKEVEDPVVYVVPNGYAYHRTPRCVTLRRSKTVNEVPLAEAVKMGRTPCRQCHPPIPVVDGPVEVDASYFETLPGVRFKSSSATRQPQGQGFQVLQVALLLEFAKNVPADELQALRQAFQESPSKFQFVALDPDHVVVCPPSGTQLPTFVLEGELTGVQGDAFRMKISFDREVTAKTKKVVVRAVQPSEQKAKP